MPPHFAAIHARNRRKQQQTNNRNRYRGALQNNIITRAAHASNHRDPQRESQMANLRESQIIGARDEFLTSNQRERARMERILEAKLKKKTIDTINSGLSFRLFLAVITLVIGLILYQDLELTKKDFSGCGNEYIPNSTVFVCLAVEILLNFLYVLWLKTTFGKIEQESKDEVIVVQKFIQDQRYAEFRYLNILYICVYLYPLIQYISGQPVTKVDKVCRDKEEYERIVQTGYFIAIFGFILIPILIIQSLQIFCWTDIETDQPIEQVQLNQIQVVQSADEQQHLNSIAQNRLGRYISQDQTVADSNKAQMQKIKQFLNEHTATISYEQLCWHEEDLLHDDCQEETCGICMLEFEELEQIKSLSCLTAKHQFHYDCIYQWFNKKTDCPICRTDFTDQMNQMKKKNEDELKALKELEKKNYEETKKRIEDKKQEQHETVKNNIVDIENQMKIEEEKQIYQFNEENLDNVHTALQDLNLNISRLQSDKILHHKLEERFQLLQNDPVVGQMKDQNTDLDPKDAQNVRDELKLLFLSVSQVDEITNQRIKRHSSITNKK